MTYYVSCGSFGSPNAAPEYYVADRDGTIVARNLSEEEAYALCAEMLESASYTDRHDTR